jgi:hypothetical protein
VAQTNPSTSLTGWTYISTLPSSDPFCTSQGQRQTCSDPHALDLVYPQHIIRDVYSESYASTRAPPTHATVFPFAHIDRSNICAVAVLPIMTSLRDAIHCCLSWHPPISAIGTGGHRSHRPPGGVVAGIARTFQERSNGKSMVRVGGCACAVSFPGIRWRLAAGGSRREGGQPTVG